MITAAVEPSILRGPIVRDGKVLVVVLKELTIYPRQLSLECLEAAFEIYKRISPQDSWCLYRIPEIQIWDRLQSPVLLRLVTDDPTEIGLFRIVKRRIAEGRSVDFRLWNRSPVDCWGLTCWRNFSEGKEHAFIRILMPLDTEQSILENAAGEALERIEMLSGHGGYVFSYDPWRVATAFSVVYGLARRFWCIDIENLNATLPLMPTWIKGISWLTLVGKNFLNPSVEAAVARLMRDSNVSLTSSRLGVLIRTGDSPVFGDRHREFREIELYSKVAECLRDVMLKDSVVFSRRFPDASFGAAWLNRFLGHDLVSARQSGQDR